MMIRNTFILFLLSILTYTAYTFKASENGRRLKEERALLNLLQVSSATGGTEETAPTGGAEDGTTDTSSVGSEATGGAATGDAAPSPPPPPPAVKGASKEEVPLPSTKMINVGCGDNIILKLDSSSLKASGLTGYSVCQAFCVNQYDTSQAVFSGTCTVNGVVFESDDEVDGATVFPTLADPSKVDRDPMCQACADPPAANVQIPSFWTEELTKSKLGEAPNGGEKALMRLPIGRSGHTVTRVDDHRVLVFGGEKSTDGCLSSKGEELLELNLAKMEWSAPTATGTQPDLSYHTTTMVMLPIGSSQWSNLTAPPTSPHMFVIGGKTHDCISGTTSYTDAIHIYSVENKKWSRFTSQSNMVQNDALDSWDGREGHSATLVGGFIYVFGGVNDETGFEGKNDLLRLSVRPDPITGQFSWTIIQRGGNNAPTSRKGHVAQLLSSRYFVVFGGFDSENAHLDDVWVYDHGANGILGNGGCSSFVAEQEGDASEVVGNTCKWSQPAQMAKTKGGLYGQGPFPRQGASSAVLGERTAFLGSSEMVIFGGQDDSLRTYYNDAWLLRVKTEKKKDGSERTEWYWQGTDLDGDSDDNMQIPERRDGAGMVYLPSYVDFLSNTDTAYSDLYKKNDKGASANKTSFLDVEEDPASPKKIPHGRRVLIFGGTMASLTKANDIFSLEIGKTRPLPPGPPEAKQLGEMTKEEIACRNNCSMHGECPSGSCKCHKGWEGVDCSVRTPLSPEPAPASPAEPKLHLPADYIIVSPSGVGCPDHCSGKGECRGGVCMCDPHWHGPICNRKMCLNGCSSRGRCHNGTCECLPGFMGEFCEVCTCTNDCNGKGACEERVGGLCGCRCIEGFTGIDCSEDVAKLPVKKYVPTAPIPAMTQVEIPPPPPKPKVDEETGEPEVEVVEEVKVDPVTNKETTVEKEVPVMEPAPPPVKIVLPNTEAPDSFTEAPKEPVNKGAAGIELSCAAGAAFKAGDKMILGLGTSNLEVMTVNEVEMSASCMETVEGIAPVPCEKNKNGKECSGRGTCDAGECLCDVQYSGKACNEYSCAAGDDCLNGGKCNANTTKCDCTRGFTGPRCNTTSTTSEARFKVVPKIHVDVKCVQLDGRVTRLNAEMAPSENGPSYSLCEFFCEEEGSSKFKGLCQINQRKFMAGGAAYVDIVSSDDKKKDDKSKMKGDAATTPETIDAWHAQRFHRLKTRLRAATGGTKITFTSPTTFAHAAGISVYRNLDVPVPKRKIKKKKKKKIGKPCGKEGTPEANCYGHGQCNGKVGLCECDENSKHWGGEHCGVSQCSRSCHTDNDAGKCVFNGKIMECKCNKGWGGEFCFEEYCPNNCNLKMNFGKCVTTKDMLSSDEDDDKDSAVHPVCEEASTNRTDLKSGGYKMCSDLSNDEEKCNLMYISKTSKGNHEIALCSFDERAKICLHEDWTMCKSSDDGKVTSIIGNPYYCKCQPGFSGNDCSGTSGCGATGHKCGENGQCVDGLCMCHIGWAGPTCQLNVCPGNCTNHGTCSVVQPDYKKGGLGRTERRCVCEAGWKGPGCEDLDECGRTAVGGACSGHGTCKDDETTSFAFCECSSSDWGGSLCEKYLPHQCPVDAMNRTCSSPSNGICVTKKTSQCKEPPCCQCTQGWYGEACESSIACPYNCSSHGKCVEATCECEEGFEGYACQDRTACPVHEGRVCGFHGKCDRGICQCDLGYEGEACHEKSPCMNGCNGEKQGQCINGTCRCRPGWDGDDCSWSTEGLCKDGCSGHGICQKATAKCYCNPGWVGDSCANSVDCPTFANQTCSGNGVCQYGRCYCRAGYEGTVDCRTPDTCPRNPKGEICGGNGVCLKGTCYCAPGYWGDACGRGAQCKKECSRNGFCNNGKCQCDIGFEGEDCTIPVQCPGMVNDPTYNSANVTTSEGNVIPQVSCSGNGRCFRNRCYCAPGFMGDDCATTMPCEDGCSDNGHCQDGICICNAGWKGENCTTVIPCEPADCHGRGVCILGTCNCHEGWTGADCSLEMPCPNDCSNRGQCFDGKCVCDFGYHGIDCAIGGHLKIELFGPKCDKNCSGHGQCDDGECVCMLDWVGKTCELPALCPANCSGHGLCQHQQCFCDPGFNGTSCAIYSGCLPGNGVPDCNSRGTCQHGQCFCNMGFHGDACEISLEEENEEDQLSKMNDECPNDDGDVCSGHGKCFAGQCQCIQGYYGVMCNSISKRDNILKVLPSSPPPINNTGGIGRGLLSLVEDAEYTKQNKKLLRMKPMLLNSNNKKKNMVVKSSNNVRFATVTSNKCPGDCTGHGDCQNGDCLCESGWSGLDCSKRTQIALEKSSGIVSSKDPITGAATTTETGTGCIATCNSARGTCETINGNTICVCKPNSMWASGNADGSANSKKCDREMCPGRCGMDDSSGIARGSCTDTGMCECDVGYAGPSCEFECENRCSSHGRCEKNMDSNSKTSYHCFCESPWTGVACDKTAHSTVVVSSMVIVAIATFIVGLCCIPLMKEYWQQREQQRYRDIIKGERDLRDQLEAMGISSANNNDEM